MPQKMPTGATGELLVALAAAIALIGHLFCPIVNLAGIHGILDKR